MIARRWCRAVVSVVAVGIGVIGLSGGAAAAPSFANGAFSIREYSFSPASATINQGDSVTWTNNGQVAHTTTSRPGAPAAWDSGSINPRGQFTRTFNLPGTYSFECAIHGAIMSGTITVAAAPVVAVPSPTADSAPSAAPADTSAVPPTDASAAPPTDVAADDGSADAPSGDDSVGSDSDLGM